MNTTSDIDRKLEGIHAKCEEQSTHMSYISQNEALYVITSREHAMRGEYKICKRKDLNIKERPNTANASHVTSDDLFIDTEFKTSNATHLEERVHNIMEAFKIYPYYDWFRIPYNYICMLINKINEGFNKELNLMNQHTRSLQAALLNDPKQVKWDEKVSNI